MGTDLSVNLCVIRTGKCRTPITKFKVDAASGRNIVRRGPISVNQASAWKSCLVEPCNITSLAILHHFRHSGIASSSATAATVKCVASIDAVQYSLHGRVQSPRSEAAILYVETILPLSQCKENLAAARRLDRQCRRIYTWRSDGIGHNDPIPPQSLCLVQGLIGDFNQRES